MREYCRRAGDWSGQVKSGNTARVGLDLLDRIDEWPMLPRVMRLERKDGRIELFSHFPLPYQLAIDYFSDSVGIHFLIWRFLLALAGGL